MDTFTGLERSYFRTGICSLAGVDEVGRGPLAGPVVAAAVILPQRVRIEGMNDSKQLSPVEREHLAPEIFRHAISVGIGLVSSERIDEINILHASIEAMHLAIAQLCVQPDHLLVDGNRFYHSSVPFTTIIGGDARCFSIAAASIIAKVERDRLMIELDRRYPQYGFSHHKGYATKKHIQALREYGPTEIHRRSFVVKELLPQLRLL